MFFESCFSFNFIEFVFYLMFYKILNFKVFYMECVYFLFIFIIGLVKCDKLYVVVLRVLFVFSGFYKVYILNCFYFECIV